MKPDDKEKLVWTAFLEGKIEESIFMNIPEGLAEVENVGEEEILEVDGSMYGLVQAARVWYQLLSDFFIPFVKK